MHSARLCIKSRIHIHMEYLLTRSGFTESVDIVAMVILFFVVVDYLNSISQSCLGVFFADLLKMSVFVVVVDEI